MQTGGLMTEQNRKYIKKEIGKLLSEIWRIEGLAEQGNRRWMQRTPAMADELTDHIWTLKELMTFRVPIQ